MKAYRVQEPEYGTDLLSGLRRAKDEAALRDAAYDAAVEIERLRAALAEIVDLPSVRMDEGRHIARAALEQSTPMTEKR